MRRRIHTHEEEDTCIVMAWMIKEEDTYI